MEVDFNPGRSPVAGFYQPTVRRTPSTNATDNTMSFERTQSLEQSLKDAPQVRPEKVAQASALVADASYPNDELLNRMAGLLARNLNR